MTGTATILRANARTLPLADASVDLIVTSPPYFALRSYTDGGEHYAGQIGSEPTPREYIASLIECTREWMRVLKPGGSIWVNLGDKYAQVTERSRNGHGGNLDGANPLRTGAVYGGRRNSGVPTKSLMMLPERYRIACVDELGLIARAVVIWSKPNGLPESVTDRVRRSHEDWVHLTKAPKYFASIDEIREPLANPGKNYGTNGAGATALRARNVSIDKDAAPYAGPNPLGKLPGSVWSIASQPLKVPAELGIDHFAAFPMEWPRRIILGWSPPAGIVLDPFGGTGTTALVAKALGRQGVSVDMSTDYCRLAEWRTTDPAQFARAQRPANPPRSVALAEPMIDFDASLNEGGDMAANKEIMRALDTLRLDRPGRSYQAAEDGGTVGAPALGIALAELAATFREEAGLWAKSGAKGWKSAEAESYTVAQRIEEVAAQLDNAGGGAALSVSEPFVPTDAATTHERLDDFVNSAVAAGKGTLRPPSMSAVQFSEPLDLGGTAVALAERPVSDGVEAYLKGEVDTLPGLAEALVPNSIADYCSDCDHDTHRCGGCGEPIAHGEGACEACAILYAPPVQIEVPEIRGIDDTSGLTDEQRAKLDKLEDHMIPTTVLPKTWESDTLTADGHRPPGLPQAPTLGQPGDMGTGYSHSYIPAGGRRVAYAELLTPVPAASLPPHLSHSQTRDVGDCATKYRLQRVEQLPQIPQWANIGGTAFHAAVEAFELTLTKMPHAPVSQMTFKDYDVETTWKHHFEGQITAVAMTTPVPQSVWRAARKGAEGEQWWRVNGPLMLRRYLDARPDEVTMDIPVIGIGGVESLCGIETDLTVDVPTPYGPLPFNAKIDRVTVGHLPGRPEVGAIIIRDYKTSYERPTDTTQLGDYANVLRLAFAHQGPIADVPILGQYFDARRGTWTEPVDLLDAHPFEAFQYRVTAAHAQKSALTTGPTPARKSDFCGGCAVRYACPIMATKT